MINTVACSIIIRKEQPDKRGECTISGQFFVNGQRVVISLSIKVEPKYFDEAKQFVKPSHPDALNYNNIISDARSRAAYVLSLANKDQLRLNKNNFRSAFTMASPDLDFIAFYEKELQSRAGELTAGSRVQHKSTLSKLKKYRSKIPFSALTADFLFTYERYLKATYNNNFSTIHRDMKNIRTYVNIALRKEYDFKNPFRIYKVKRAATRVIFLTVDELHILLDHYKNHKTSEHCRVSLLALLVSCYTSLRISDIRQLNPGQLNDKVLCYLPKKSKRFNRYCSIPLSDVAQKLLHDFFSITSERPLKSDQKINDDLKLIAAYANIRKTLSMHVGRHTFATTFLLLGGRVEVLQQLLGHSKISDTMIYVHIVDKQKEDQMKNFDTEFNN